MKLLYTEENDTLIVQLAQEKIEDFYETEHMVVHVDCRQNPVLVEIPNVKNLTLNLDQLMAAEIGELTN
jgi:hypothetical protein